MKRLKFDRIEFSYSWWFTFILSIDIQNCGYMCGVDKEIYVNFLWWHARFYWMTKGGAD